MKIGKSALIIYLVLTSLNSFAQKKGNKDSIPDRKIFASSSYLTFTNWVGKESVSMYELHVGYKITPKDLVGIKVVTWRLYQPLGIPIWDPALMSSSENEWYPGRIREFGIGVRYQRFLWKGLFASVEVVPMIKKFLNENLKKIDDGFRLYSSYHIGYHIPLFRNRMFVEPQIHCNYWPVNSKGPEAFAEKENKWNNYFLFEPNLYIGIKL